jgi:hypothetical protein
MQGAPFRDPFNMMNHVPKANNKVKTMEELITLFSIDGTTGVNIYNKGDEESEKMNDSDLKEMFEKLVEKREVVIDVEKKDRGESGEKDSKVSKIKPVTIKAEDKNKLDKVLDQFEKERADMNAAFVQPTQEQIDSFFTSRVNKKWMEELKHKDMGDVVMDKYLSDRAKLDEVTKSEISKKKRVARFYKTLYKEMMATIEAEFTAADIEVCLIKYATVLEKLLGVDVKLKE